MSMLAVNAKNLADRIVGSQAACCDLDSDLITKEIVEIARVALLELARNTVLTMREEAEQLEKWADESQIGGWSTHQVDPMRKRAAELRTAAARYRA